MNARVSSIQNDVNARFGDIGARISRVESKLDHIGELLVSYALDVARIKEKLGI